MSAAPKLLYCPSCAALVQRSRRLGQGRRWVLVDLDDYVNRAGQHAVREHVCHRTKDSPTTMLIDAAEPPAK
jgi:hypothetical protein